MLISTNLLQGNGCPFNQRWEQPFPLFISVINPFNIYFHIPREGQDRSIRTQGIGPSISTNRDVNGGLIKPGLSHLTGNGALPDQVIETVLIRG